MNATTTTSNAIASDIQDTDAATATEFDTLLLKRDATCPPPLLPWLEAIKTLLVIINRAFLAVNTIQERMDKIHAETFTQSEAEALVRRQSQKPQFRSPRAR